MSENYRNSLNIKDTKKCKEAEGVVSDEEFRIDGPYMINYRIANRQINAKIHFTDDAILRGKDYSVIIGTDVLEKFNKIALNFIKKQIIFDDIRIPVINMKRKNRLTINLVIKN